PVRGASHGRPPPRHVSPRKNTRIIEARNVEKRRWDSLFLAKRLQHSCSTLSSKKNIFRKLWASRNKFLEFRHVRCRLSFVAVLASAANSFSGTLDFIHYKQ